MSSRRVPLAWVAFILVMILALWAPVPRAQTAQGGKKIDATVVDPQAAIKVAAAAFKQAKPIPNFAPPKTPWGDPDLRGTYLTATYTPLQRPERLKESRSTSASCPITRASSAMASSSVKNGLSFSRSGRCSGV